MDAADVAGIPLFADLDEDARAHVATLFHEATVPKGRRLVRAGEFGYRFFAVLAGTAKVTVAFDRTFDLGPGDVFGEIGLLETERRIADVTATSPMRVASMMVWNLRELLDEHPELRDRLEALMADRLRRDRSS